MGREREREIVTRQIDHTCESQDRRGKRERHTKRESEKERERYANETKSLAAGHT